MKSTVVLLGGVIAAGKSTLARELVAHHQFIRVSTGAALEKRALAQGLAINRSVLQRMGDELDEETDGVWTIDLIDEARQGNPAVLRFLVDSARRDFQIRHARSRWSTQALYVHLTVPFEVARSRYEARRATERESDELVPFEEAKRSPTEVHAETLAKYADVILDMHELSPAAAASEVAAAIQRAASRCA